MHHACTRTCTGRFWTAAQGLYHPKRLGLVEPPAKVAGEEWVYIHGGACASLYLSFQFEPDSHMALTPPRSLRRPVRDPARCAFRLQSRNNRLAKKLRAGQGPRRVGGIQLPRPRRRGQHQGRDARLGPRRARHDQPQGDAGDQRGGHLAGRWEGDAHPGGYRGRDGEDGRRARM